MDYTKCEVVLKTVVDGVEEVHRHDGTACLLLVEKENERDYSTHILSASGEQSCRLMSAAIFQVVERYLVDGVSTDDIAAIVFYATKVAIENAVRSVKGEGKCEH